VVNRLSLTRGRGISTSGADSDAGSADEEAGRAEIRLQGLHAYPGSESVPAGESIQFHVSREFPYRFGITKLGPEADDRSSDVTVFTAAETFAPRVQPIRPGSWIRTGKRLPPDEPLEALEALTVECWVRPWSLDGWQGIVTQHDYPKRCGFGLFLDGSDRPVFLMGSGGVRAKGAQVAGPKLERRQGHHLAGVKAKTPYDPEWADESAKAAGATSRPGPGAGLAADPRPDADEVARPEY